MDYVMKSVLLFLFRDHLLSILLVLSPSCKKRWPILRVGGTLVGLMPGFSGSTLRHVFHFSYRLPCALISRHPLLQPWRMTIAALSPAGLMSTSSLR